MSKKKIIVGLLVTAFSVLIIFFALSNIKKNDQNMTINKAFADWSNHYTDFNDMENAADLIIKGDVIDSYTEQRVDLIFTKQSIEISEMYKGNLKIGDKIEVLQTGGTLNNITTPPFEEAPLLEKGSDYLLLLQYTPEGHYLILGGYQGVGLVKDDNIVFNSSNDEISQEFKDKKFNDVENILNDKFDLME